MSDFLTITLDDSRILARVAQMQPRLGQSLRLAVAAAVIDLQNYIRTQKLSGQTLHVRTGNLRNAVRAHAPTSDAFPIIGDVAVGREAPYGRYQEYGTAAHEIVPVRAKALRFQVNGNVVFARHVSHPGLKARPFMSPSLVEKRGTIVEQLRAAVARVVKE